MTSYAIDQDTNLLRIWATGRGQRAAVVGKLAGTAAAREQLAATLTLLSESLWRCYTHPASFASDREINTDGRQRQLPREAFAEVITAVREPNVPGDDRLLIVSYDQVEESAHRVGRALREFADVELTKAVVDDIVAEISAVESAARDDLSGRAVQAVALSRAAASPMQVAAADSMLARNPLSSDQLLLELDPVSASVAAAHWLKAAAAVAADKSGMHAARVLSEAAGIEALPITTPNEVLERFGGGNNAFTIVPQMVSDAMQVADGFAPDLGALLVHHGGRPEGEDGTATPVRLTPLDPRRPAHDLLEDLLAGIEGCRTLYGEYIDDRDDQEAIDMQFCKAVRERASASRDQLM
ncbi:hypothetical protein [Actinoplanes sp. NPDC051859]|uniref:hypothetical protein n=1 Tax=Actinoplanes sp. NPDC051859 TaxID=3363909 RepID=UPI0037B3DD87